MKLAPLLILPLALLAGGAGKPDASIAHGRLGQTLDLGRLRVTPLRVIEDSRCPVQVSCVWAGRLRLLARIQSGHHRHNQELTLGVPATVAGGKLELLSAVPRPSRQGAAAPGAYRFGLRFRADARPAPRLQTVAATPTF